MLKSIKGNDGLVSTLYWSAVGDAPTLAAGSRLTINHQHQNHKATTYLSILACYTLLDFVYL